MNTKQVEAFAELGALFRGLQVESFADSGKANKISDPEILQDLQLTLEEGLGRVDRVYDVTFDGEETFKGKADQKISLGKSKVFTFTISSDQVYYKPVNSADVMQYAESDEGWAAMVEFAAKGKGSKAGKKLNCKPGNYQCGGRCQSDSRGCPSQMTPEQRKAYQSALRKARAAAKKAEPTKPTKPTKESKSQTLDNVLKQNKQAFEEVEKLADPSTTGMVDRLKSVDRVLQDFSQGKAVKDEIQIKAADSLLAKARLINPDTKDIVDKASIEAVHHFYNNEMTESARNAWALEYAKERDLTVESAVSGKYKAFDTDDADLADKEMKKYASQSGHHPFAVEIYTDLTNRANKQLQGYIKK